MSFLDMKTVVFAFLIYNVLISGILFSLWLQNRKRYDGITFWLADFLLQAIAQLLIALRGHIPDFISIVISNTMVILGLALFYIGLRRFTGKKDREAWCYMYLPIFVAVQIYYTYFIPSLTYRIINTSAGIMFFSFLTFIFMLSIPDRKLRLIGRGTGIVFLLYSLVASGRIIFLVFVPRGNDFFHANLFDILSIFVFMILGVMLTFALILMINGRLLLEIRAYAAEKEKIASNLSERVKELNCLYAITSLYENPGTSIDDILKATAGYIPAALQYPQAAGARIVYNGEEFAGGKKGEAKWRTGSDIMVRGMAAGRVESFYGAERPDDTRDPFLDEERAMIGAIAKHLGGTIEKLNAEKDIRGLLNEKELLLTEVHHRIKNNMASITSLLSIQADMADNESTREALTAAKNRTYAMMDLYDRLYRQSEYESHSIKDYITSMVSELRAAYDSDGTITIDTDIDDIILTTRQLFPLGIIINELVTNALKYAFDGVADRAILLSLHKRTDGSLTIMVSDNGRGMKERKQKTSGFGLILVETLIKQLGGSSVISWEGGTHYAITIPGDKNATT